MMAPHAGGRPASSRQVRLVPVRRSGMDHRAVARIVLALAQQMATDEAAQSAAVDEVVSSGAEVCAKSARRTSVGRCAAERLPSCRHTSAHHSPHEAAAPSSMPGGTP